MRELFMTFISLALLPLHIDLTIVRSTFKWSPMIGDQILGTGKPQVPVSLSSTHNLGGDSIAAFALHLLDLPDKDHHSQ